jgi:hypothetical protein
VLESERNKKKNQSKETGGKSTERTANTVSKGEDNFGTISMQNNHQR